MAKTLSITTWNINSVRLRIDQVLRLLAEDQPDVLCLQETKCPDPVFPTNAFAKAGYPHQSFIGMKGYNGVAILSASPFARWAPARCAQSPMRGISRLRSARADQPSNFTISMCRRAAISLTRSQPEIRA